MWVNGFHHSMRTFLTGFRRFYYEPYAGTASEVAGVVNTGHLTRSTSNFKTDQVSQSDSQDPSAHVFYLQNHDRVGNRELGRRIQEDIGVEMYAVASATLLFCPETPLLFMGQEFMASTPFYFFTDFSNRFGESIAEHRREEFADYIEARRLDPVIAVPDPQDEQTYIEANSICESAHQTFRY